MLQEQNRDVAKKLGTATALMFTMPLIVFYLCQYYVFTERDNPEAWSGGMAIVTVNCVIAWYVVSSFSEDDDGGVDNNRRNTEATLLKDEDGPRTGFNKTRTD